MGQERGVGSTLRDTEFEVMNEHSVGTRNKPRAFLSWRYKTRDLALVVIEMIPDTVRGNESPYTEEKSRGLRRP